MTETRYIPDENTQLTDIHRKAESRCGDILITIQDETADLYRPQIDRLLNALAELLAPVVTENAIDQARALVKEMRCE